MDLCRHGHDRATEGRNKRGECRACVADQKRRQIAKNPAAAKARCARWYRANAEKQAATKREQTYGLSADAFQALVEFQAGLCAVCCEPMRPGKSTHIDHDHQTGAVRGLLCHYCNVGIGNLRDDAIRCASAAAYLGAY